MAAPELCTNVAAALQAVATPLAVFAGDRVLLANASLERLLGRSLSETSLCSEGQWLSQDSRDRLQACIAACMDGGSEQAAIHLEGITAGDAHRPLEAIARGLPVDGRFCALVSFQDLADVQHVQNSLLQLTAVLRQVIENSPVPMFVLDADGAVTHWNAQCVRWTGVSAEQALGSTRVCALLRSAEERSLAERLLADPNAARERTSRTQLHFDAAGHPRWVIASAAPLSDPGGQLVGAIETLQDITELREAQQKLTQHQLNLENVVAERTKELVQINRELDSFLDNVPVGIIRIEDQRIARGNKKFLSMFGLGADDADELDLRDLFVSIDTYDALMQSMSGAAAPHRPAAPSEVQMRTAGGARLCVQMITYCASGEADGNVSWWLMQDRTEVVRAEQEIARNYENLQAAHQQLEQTQSQLLQSEKMASIGQLAAGVAHEINNPIGFVSSNLGSLKQQVLALLALTQAYMHSESAEQRLDLRLQGLKDAAEVDFLAEDLPLLLSESEEGLGRVRKIVQDLKNFSRVDHAEWQDADLNAGLESTLNVVMNEVKYKAEIRKELVALPKVSCLAGQLNQVFMNLIVNAAQSIEERGVITLRSGFDERAVWIEIADTGCGMSPETQRRIFEPFFTTKPVGRGTGLGLSVSFSIVKKHQGSIEVVSSPGQGSTFRITIPRQLSPAAAAGAERPRGAAQPTGELRAAETSALP